MKTKALVPFLVISFGLTWGLAALFLLFYDPITAIFGEVGYSNPLFILAVYSPAIAGIFLVWRHYGMKGLASFFRRLTLWRTTAIWWLFLIAGIPLLFYISAALQGPISDPFPFSPWYQVLPALALALFIGPIEEFGWRGVALPLLQRRFAPFWASIILGAIWGIWHIPAFLIGGTPQSAWAFAPYFIGVIALSVILTPIFNSARGSLLIPFLFHFQMNNPLWPDAQPLDTLFFVFSAIFVVWLKREKIFQVGTGVTEVLMPEEESIITEQPTEPTLSPG